ncbi:MULTISPECIES: hypothetical protein [unclassified Sphingomonas]|jgi:hypothetical protein|uniref:hypothetical protein n=1 Tax=unclassified Sphingomonas TaxID=196159 RepID=UPI000A4BB0EC|nr:MULTISPECIES: hypothetical protein [unclassified Sphingomonas]
MARQQDVFTLVGNRMRIAPTRLDLMPTEFDRPSISDLICRIDRALQQRRAA